MYGYEVVILVEVLLLTPKSGTNDEDNGENCAMNLIILEEKREKAMIKMEVQKWSIRIHSTKQPNNKT